MDKNLIIKKTKEYVKEKLSGDSSGHDWWHVYRVWKNAIHIGKSEDVDMFVVELAALLHDISDWKFSKGDENAGPSIARKWLETQGIEEKTVSHVCEIIKDVSFKGSGQKNKIKTVEGMVVQDADRLDAIGAIGIARAFATGAKFDELMHDPDITVPKYNTAEEYKLAKGKKGRTVINHFYEKLLLLKDTMNTQTARKIATKRHEYMKKYLKQFYSEWEGKI